MAAKAKCSKVGAGHVRFTGWRNVSSPELDEEHVVPLSEVRLSAVKSCGEPEYICNGRLVSPETWKAMLELLEGREPRWVPAIPRAEDNVFMVLSDGETYSGLGGCKIVRLAGPQEALDNCDADAVVKHGADDEECPGIKVETLYEWGKP